MHAQEPCEHRRPTGVASVVAALRCLADGLNTPRSRRRTTVIATVITLVVGTVIVGAAPRETVALRSASSTCAKQYVVVAGDGWWVVSRKVGVSMDALLAANNATTSTPLYLGSTICLPDNATNTTVASSSSTAPATGGSDTSSSTTTTTVAPVVQMAAFPVQGPCWYADTWQAPRGGGRLHEGVDVIAKSGQFLYAVVDGTLTKQAFDRPGSLAGNAWWLTAADGTGTYYFYAHLVAFAPGLKVGSRVKAGQIIGWVGRTGNASSPHLHFEIHPNGGRAINPTPSVRAVDACRTTEPPPQPDGVIPTLPADAGTPTTTVPASPTSPTTAPPAASTPVTTAPATGGGSGSARWSFIAPRTAQANTRVAGGQRKIRVNQLSGVPSGTRGVMLRLTVTGTGLPGWMVAHPCDTPTPAVSTLSYGAWETSVGSQVVEVVDGSVCVFTSTPADAKVEVLASMGSSGVGVEPVSARRVADTRTTGRLGPGTSLSLSQAQLGVGSGTPALTIVVTLVNPAADGTLSLGFCGSGPWQTPISRQPISSFSMTMRTSPSGWCLSSSVETDVIIDITGEWRGAAVPMAVDPARAFDSRNNGARIWNTPVPVRIAGVAGVPADATRALISITTVTGSLASSAFVVPCGQPRSPGSVTAQTANRVASAVIPVGLTNGSVCISAIHPTDVIIDVLGAD